MLLFLDVDGTLLPFGAVGDSGPVGAARSSGASGPVGAYPLYEPVFALPAEAAGHPLLARVDPALGARLASLGCELVWATTWMDDANTCLAPWLGLPPLPLVDWPDADADDEGRTGLHWKTRPLVSWAAGRDFIWVDDEVTDADRVWVAGHHPGKALVHRVEAQRGLVDEDFAVLEEWIRG